MNPQSKSHQGTLTKIAIFKGKQIRKIIYNNEWCFSVVDVCSVLTDSVDAGAYWRKLKQTRSTAKLYIKLCMLSLKNPLSDLQKR